MSNRLDVSDEIIPETPLIARTDTEEDANLFPGLIKTIGSTNANMLLEKVAEINAGEI